MENRHKVCFQVKGGIAGIRVADGLVRSGRYGEFAESVSLVT